jgi:hypothetical protein
VAHGRGEKDQAEREPGMENSAVTSFNPHTQAAELAARRKPSNPPPMPGVNPAADRGRVVTAADYARNLRDGRAAKDAPSGEPQTPTEENSGPAFPSRSKDAAGDGRTVTYDARAATRALRNYLPGSNAGISAQEYQDRLRAGRKAMTQDAAAATTKARVTGAEFAALHDKAAAAAGGRAQLTRIVH